MNRREVITVLGGAAAWPVTAQAQQGERKRRIGVLLSATPNDSEYPLLVNSFLQGLQQLGWREEQNLGIEIRWSGASADAIRKNATATGLAILLASRRPLYHPQCQRAGSH
jgi:putative tryptophan/tyrosine transport system substrate-binding protein